MVPAQEGAWAPVAEEWHSGEDIPWDMAGDLAKALAGVGAFAGIILSSLSH